MAEFEGLAEVLVEELRDLYSAETQVAAVLPAIMKIVSNTKLKEALQTQLQETQLHVARLEQAGKMLDTKVSGKTCQGMRAIVAETVDRGESRRSAPDMRDTSLLGGLSRMGNYQIAAYSFARSIAEQLAEDVLSDLLEKSLAEQEASYDNLAMLAEDEIFEASLVDADLDAELDAEEMSDELEDGLAEKNR